jgi:predicted secreted protein
MESLQEVYGAVTDACRNRVINDMIRDTVIKVKKSSSKNKSNDIQEQSKGKLKKALDLINEAQALSN